MFLIEATVICAYPVFSLGLSTSLYPGRDKTSDREVPLQLQVQLVPSSIIKMYECSFVPKKISQDNNSDHAH